MTSPIKSTKYTCECTDPGCPVHSGKSQCTHTSRLTPVYRIDMEDQTGTLMCPACLTDALDSGVFTTEK
jgi:hypothetical protein